MLSQLTLRHQAVRAVGHMAAQRRPLANSTPSAGLPHLLCVLLIEALLHGAVRAAKHVDQLDARLRNSSTCEAFIKLGDCQLKRCLSDCKLLGH